MRSNSFHFVNILFITVGVAVGIIFALQIEAQPPLVGSFPADQIEAQKNLLNTFSLEQETLKQKIAALEEKTGEAEEIIARRSSKQTLQKLKTLRQRTGFAEVKGEGVRITLSDSPTASRVGFSTTSENFVQASDLRDLINSLFLKNIQAISLNGTRVTALTSVQAVFDSVLVDNIQISPPFIIEVVGVQNAIIDAARVLQKRKIQLRAEPVAVLTIPGVKNIPAVHFLSSAQ